MKNLTMKKTGSASILMAALLGLGASVQAQTEPSAYGAAATDKSKLREEARGRSAATATTASPGRAGEASTMVRGKPNEDPNDPRLLKSKAEIKAEKEMLKAQRKQEREMSMMGQRGAQVGAEPGTPAVSPAGNPSVFKGGTPK